MNTYSKYITPITKEDFNYLVNIKFNNILEGFEVYNSKTLTSKDGISRKDGELNIINFIIDIYYLNLSSEEGGMIIDFYFNKLTSEQVNNLKVLLDDQDKLILEDIINKSKDSEFLIINDPKIIPFFVRLCTREVFFITFYCRKFPLTIWGNYNLSFPMFYQEENTLKTYENLLVKNDIKIY